MQILDESVDKILDKNVHMKYDFCFSVFGGFNDLIVSIFENFDE